MSPSQVDLGEESEEKESRRRLEWGAIKGIKTAKEENKKAWAPNKQMEARQGTEVTYTARKSLAVVGQMGLNFMCLITV